MRLFDRIKFDGTGNNESWLVYKAGLENITLGSQLIVGMGQEAIFVKGGRAQDIFTPGTYTLQTGNLPLVGNIVGRAFGGNTPFTAEIVFVNTTNNIVLKWGTSTPINTEDPKYGLILGLRAHGKFAVKVDHTRHFVNQLVGTVQLGSGLNEDVIWNKFSSLIITTFASRIKQFMKDNNLSFLDVAAYYRKISEDTFKELQPDFKDCGLELMNFLVEDVSPPSDQIAELMRRKEDLMFGEEAYNRRRVLEIAEKTGNQEIGKIIAQSIFGSNTRTSSSTPPPPPPPSTNSNTTTCPSCHGNIDASSRFCPLCGHPVPQQRFCSHCGHTITQGANFCSNCGERCQ